MTMRTAQGTKERIRNRPQKTAHGALCQNLGIVHVFTYSVDKVCRLLSGPLVKTREVALPTRETWGKKALWVDTSFSPLSTDQT